MVTTTEYAQLSASAYDSGGVGDVNANWIRTDYTNLSDGFSASTYENTSTGEVVVAYRGTNSILDAAADVESAMGIASSQYSDAVNYYNNIAAQYGSENISVTGHSLGGALASYVAALNPSVQATVFNAAGIANVEGVPSGSHTNINNYNTRFDPVSNLPLDQIGNVSTVSVYTPNQIPTFFAPFIAAGIAVLQFLLHQHSISSLVNANFTAAQKNPYRSDPLTLDLNGDGLNTVPLSTPPLMFDINATGIKTSVGWVAPTDGLLVMDRNGNGLIDSGAELFGNATPAYGTTANGMTADGFAALAQEDTNHDGIVNAQDANFASLRVWQDLNQDGISQSSELTTLDQQGIVSFNVGSTQNSQLLANGNQIANLGTYTRTDGSTGSDGAPTGMGDINLAVDTFHSTFTDNIPLTSATQALLNMQGSGMARDLKEAASLQAANDAVFEVRRMGNAQ